MAPLAPSDLGAGERTLVLGGVPAAAPDEGAVTPATDEVGVGVGAKVSRAVGVAVGRTVGVGVGAGVGVDDALTWMAPCIAA